MYEYKFPMAGVTATVIVYNPATGEVLLGLRRPDSNAYPNTWCLPGGYLNVGTERVINVARRETREETGLDISEDRWTLFYNDDVPGDDPRYTQVVNACYFVHLTNEEYEDEKGVIKAGDDLVDLKWVDYEEAEDYDLAFAHNTILSELWRFNEKFNL